MSLFIKRVIIFFLSVIVVITTIQILISLRISGKTVTGHDNLEVTSNINADLVFLGSSRCWAHFDPNFFDTAYKIKSLNIGVDGHSEIIMAIVRLEDYLSRNKAPQMAILSFDPFMGADSDATKNTNFVHKDNFSRYAFWPSKKDRLIVDYFHFDCYEKYVPLYAIFKYQQLKNDILLNNIDNWTKYGYEKHDETWDTISNPVSDINKSSYFKISDSHLIKQALNSLKTLCEHHKIKLICIQTPVYKACYDEQLFSETKRIAESLNIPFIDANKEYIRNDIGNFYNSNHLNINGTNKLNDFLKNDSLFNFHMQKLNH